METSVYVVEVVFFNEVTQEEDGMFYSVCAKNYADAEEKVIKDAGEFLIDIINITKTDYVPLV